MNDRFKEAYKKLSLDDKRNELSNELIVIANYLDVLKNINNINSEIEISNYQIGNEEKISEEEFLLQIYNDIYNISKELVTILKVIEQKNI